MHLKTIFGIILPLRCRFKLQIYKLFNEPEHTNNKRQITIVKTVKKLDSKLQKQQLGWPKISNMERKVTAMIKSLENYDSEV